MTELPCVLDASAIIAWINDETGAPDVERLMPGSYITSVNATEVAAWALRRGWSGSTEQLLAALRAHAVAIEPVVEADVHRAAALLAQRVPSVAGRAYSISLGDAVCIAVAERLGVPVVSGERAWDALAMQVPHYRFRD